MSPTLRTPAVGRALRRAIDQCGLDLRGMTVLTEAATGSFAVTAPLAAAAGADLVLARATASEFGSVDDARAQVTALARALGVEAAVEVTTAPTTELAPLANVVTNLRGVRPIDEAMIAALPADAGIALMFEPWEHRPADVDLDACRRHGVPVLGTREAPPELHTFAYVALAVVRLLLEGGCEILNAAIVIVGSDPLGSAATTTLQALGAGIRRLDPTLDPQGWAVPVDDADAVVFVEHRTADPLVGGPHGLSAADIASAGALVVHVCGNVSDAELEDAGVPKVPSDRVAPGTMTVTAGYVGPGPVIELHAAGLRVGQALVEGMRTFGDRDRAEQFALTQSLAMGWSDR